MLLFLVTPSFMLIFNPFPLPASPSFFSVLLSPVMCLSCPCYVEWFWSYSLGVRTKRFGAFCLSYFRLVQHLSRHGLVGCLKFCSMFSKLEQLELQQVLGQHSFSCFITGLFYILCWNYFFFGSVYKILPFLQKSIIYLLKPTRGCHTFPVAVLH